MTHIAAVPYPWPFDGALERGNLREQHLAGAGAGHALNDDLVPGLGKVANLEHRGEDGDEQRPGHQRQADQHQSAQ